MKPAFCLNLLWLQEVYFASYTCFYLSRFPFSNLLFGYNSKYQLKYPLKQKGPMNTIILTVQVMKQIW